jgi:hypothetical protein
MSAMALKSAYEDLFETTLGTIQGLWGKLCYLAGRREADGYKHWGFERAHGAETTQDTFSQAHQSLIATILRSRLKVLQDDVQHSSGVEGLTPASYLERLNAGQSQLVPSESPKATELHLRSVLKALANLEGQEAYDTQSSSQSPPPGR